MTKEKINALGNVAAMILGLLFLGDIFELWRFQPFEGWWLAFLYIPVVCGLATTGLTRGTVMLGCTAAALTIAMFVDADGRVWGAALIAYLAYSGWRAAKKDLHPAKQPKDTQSEE